MKVLASWDDGAKEDLRLADLMAKYEIETIFYIPSEWQTYNMREKREPLSFEDLLDLSSNFTIGSHGITHSMLTRIPEPQMEREVRDSGHSLEHLLDKEVTTFCYPRGYANDYIREVVRSHYTHARNTLVGNITMSPDPIWDTPSVHVCGVRRPEYEYTTWQKEASRLLREAINTPDSVYHMWGHSWEISRYDGWYDLEELLKEVTAR